MDKIRYMKKSILGSICLVLAWPLLSNGQQAGGRPGLFGQDELLPIQISGNLHPLLDDRGDNPAYHSMTLSYRGADSLEISIPIDIKTRGHFRKSKDNCAYPPLLLNFSKAKKKPGGIFSEQSKLKLVMPCGDDSYVVREWLVYKLYNLITPESFRARLVKVYLNDTQKKKTATPFFGILLEEEGQMAIRNQRVLVSRKMLRPESTEMNSFLNMAVFQYMIANTDWSIQYQQNIKFLAPDSLTIPHTVPYDFDHAGIVSTPYALPAEELQMTSVRERRYRGFCMGDMSRFGRTIALFNQLKDQFYAVYTHCPLLDAKYVRSTTAFLDAFYKTINDPKDCKKEFTYPCDPN